MQPTTDYKTGANTNTTATGVMPIGTTQATGVVPAGHPSKEDRTLYRKGSSSSSSSSSDEENVTRKEVVTTETRHNIPHSLPAEHVREAPTTLPTQHIAANIDTNPRPNFPTRLPSEHVYDKAPNMYHGKSDTVTHAGVVRSGEGGTGITGMAGSGVATGPGITHGMRDMNVGEKKVTVTGAAADRLEARDRAMGKQIVSDNTATGGKHTEARPMGGTGTGMTGTGMTGTGTGMTGTHTGTTTTGATTGTTTSGTTGAAGHHEKPGLMDKVKAMLPGHHAK